VTRLPEPATFFVDRSLGGKIVAAALRSAGAVVEVHDDHFKKDDPDELWLTKVGASGWVALTKDEQILHRPAEIVALFEAATAVFVLVGGDLKGSEIARAWVAALPVMRDIIAQTDVPFVARVRADGAVSVALNAEGVEVRARRKRAKGKPTGGA
jgi:hypothetical protein